MNKVLKIFFLISFCTALSGGSGFCAEGSKLAQVKRRHGAHCHCHRRVIVCKSLQESLRKSKLSPAERRFLSRVLEQLEKSAVGRKVISQLDGEFDFTFKFVKFPKASTWGTYSPGVIKLNSNFLRGRCKHVKMHNFILCSSVVIHEMTHSIHRKNQLKLLNRDPSWESLLKDIMFREMHCRVNQFELSVELVNLLWTEEYQRGSHAHRFMALREAAAWNELVESYSASGHSKTEAEAFARQALIKHLWRNARQPEYADGKVVKYSIARSWHRSYGPAAGKLPAKNGKGMLNTQAARQLIDLLNGGVDYQYFMENFPYIIRDDRIDAAPWCSREYFFPDKIKKAQTVKSRKN